MQIFIHDFKILWVIIPTDVIAMMNYFIFGDKSTNLLLRYDYMLIDIPP